MHFQLGVQSDCKPTSLTTLKLKSRLLLLDYSGKYSCFFGMKTDEVRKIVQFAITVKPRLSKKHDYLKIFQIIEVMAEVAR